MALTARLRGTGRVGSGQQRPNTHLCQTEVKTQHFAVRARLLIPWVKTNSVAALAGGTVAAAAAAFLFTLAQGADSQENGCAQHCNDNDITHGCSSLQNFGYLA